MAGLKARSFFILLVSGSVFLGSNTIATAGRTAKPAPQAQQANKSNAPLSAADAKKLKSPEPFTKKSIARGRSIFVRNCVACHGPDGKATMDVVANATDLTSPGDYKHGTTEGEIFRDIRDGASDSMPAFKSQIHQEEDIWHLVNFIRSLWPEAMRPALVEKEADEPPASKDKPGDQK